MRQRFDPVVRDRDLPRTELPPEPPAPRWSDALAGGERRSAFARFWFRDYPEYALKLNLSRVFARLPLPVSARIGATLGGLSLRLGLVKPAKRAAANLRMLRPDLSDAAVECMVRDLYRGIGSVYAEIPSTPRFIRESLMDVEGLEHLKAAYARGPVITVSVHLGNWEALCATIGVAIGRLWTIIDPPRNFVTRSLVNAFRKKSQADIVFPTRAGTLTATRALMAGGVVSMFCDEIGPDGRNRAPLFGREPDPRSNLGVAVRLARMSGATLLPCCCVRNGHGRYTAKLGPPLELPPDDGTEAGFRRDMLIVNAAIEERVLAHLDQWYFLDSRMDDIRRARPKAPGRAKRPAPRQGGA